MVEQPEEPDRSAYDPTGLPPGAPSPARGPGQARPLPPLPPLREVAELRTPSTLGGALYLVVVGVGLLGVVIAWAGSWRTGVAWLAVALIGAAAARIVLSDDSAGMLRVRRKWLDAVTLAAVGVVLIVLVVTIPDQPL